MENASKALIMAGGVLIALMIIGALLLMFNQLSAYQKNDSISEKDTQLATFNQDFTKYADENNLKGTDIISIANKVIDYNRRRIGTDVSNYVDYNIEITLHINLTGFAEKYGTKSRNKVHY